MHESSEVCEQKAKAPISGASLNKSGKSLANLQSAAHQAANSQQSGA
jgi:hypothetical protein